MLDTYNETNLLYDSVTVKILHKTHFSASCHWQRFPDTNILVFEFQLFIPVWPVSCLMFISYIFVCVTIYTFSFCFLLSVINLFMFRLCLISCLHLICYTFFPINSILIILFAWGLCAPLCLLPVTCKSFCPLSSIFMYFLLIFFNLTIYKYLSVSLLGFVCMLGQIPGFDHFLLETVSFTYCTSVHLFAFPQPLSARVGEPNTYFGKINMSSKQYKLYKWFNPQYLLKEANI